MHFPGVTARCVAALLAATVAIAACGGDDDSSTTVPATVDRDAIAAATVGIEATGCGPRPRLGRGTVVDAGLVLTAAHTLAGSDAVVVVSSDGSQESTARVVFFDPDVDVAAVRVDDPTPPAVTLSAAAVVGGEPAVVAFADGDAWDVRDVEVGDALVIRTTDIYRESDVERDGFKVAAAVEEGDSGSMVHQADGGVGIIWARSNIEPDQAWAVAIPEVFFDAGTRPELTDEVDTGSCT